MSIESELELVNQKQPEATSMAYPGSAAVGYVAARALRERVARSAQRLRPVERRVPSRLSRLKAVVLLSGSVGAESLAAKVGRSVLNLPLASDRTLLDVWREQVAELAEELGTRLPCRILVSQSTPLPRFGPVDIECGMTAEPDPQELRGTGGVLRDLVARYDDDDCLLVANAAQLFTRSLVELAHELDSVGGEFSLTSNAEGKASNLFLFSAGTLRELPAVGFVDLKEQGLPQVARSHMVTVVSHLTPAGLPIRTLPDYLSAIRAFEELRAGRAVRNPDPFAEHWRPAGSIVEEGAYVAAGARLHDAIILAGGRVESGAMVARSIVCGGAVVWRKSQVRDRIVTSEI